MTTRTRRRPPRGSRAPGSAAIGREIVEQIKAHEAGAGLTDEIGWYHVSDVYALAADEDKSTASSADVYVYDDIGGWWGMTAEDFVRDVASLDVDRLVVHLNSPGGAASEGSAIANVLRAHRAKVRVRIDGLAASAASIIAMAADPYDEEADTGGVIAGIGAEMMIHDAWGYAAGNAAQVRKAAERLDSASNAYAAAYASRAGGTAAEWRAVMEAETWYTGEEMVAAGLADRVATADETGTAEGEQVTPGGRGGGFWDLWDSLSRTDRFDLAARYSYAGRAAAPAPHIPARTTPAAAAAGSAPTDTQERSPAVAFSDEQLTTMRQRLNLADDADEAAILAALDTRLAEPAPPPTQAPGTVVLDDATHAQLLADARDGREARAQQLAERRERLVQAAIDDGRIPVARKADWLEYLETAPNPANAEADLAKLKPGLVPIEEIGYASKDTPADPAAGDDYWFAGVPGVKVEA